MGPLDRRPWDRDRHPRDAGLPGPGGRVPAAALAVLAGVAVYAVSVVVFPHHSINHDEAVYLQQAEMLLAGELFLHPPVEGVFRPWFFVADAGRLYPKYAPVPAVAFAAGELAGDPRLALAGVAAGLCYLTIAVTAEAFDRRTGLLAGAFVVASPLFVVDAAVFLPYAPTALLNLTFALGYLRADRTGRVRWAALAGVAIGLAFFARPYTAVLFAAPFVGHALWTLRSPDRRLLARQGVVAAGGAGGVALALAYNAATTGSPLLFPYEAFAPRDGLGFGRRAILGYERTYTPSLGLAANARVVWSLLTRWVVAGPLGTALAGAGLLALAGRAARRLPTDRPPSTRRGEAAPGSLAGRVVLAGLFVSVPAGNVLFWGNLNLLGSLSDAGDGLIRYLGPYYHFDLLVPVAAFAAAGALWIGARIRRTLARRLDRPWDGRVGVAVLLVCGAVFVAVAGAALAAPLWDNHQNSRQLEAAYEPVDHGGPPQSVVFLPTPHGDWLNHPFQTLRNDPHFDGPTVYAIDERPFAVADAYPDRRLYRYVYRGTWAPMAGEPVEAHLQRVRRVAGDRIDLSSTVGLPPGTEASIRLAGDDDVAYYDVRGTPRTLATELVVADGTARLRGDRLVALDPGNASVALPDGGGVRVTVFADAGRAAGFSYRLSLPVDADEGRLRALSPHVSVCRAPRRCPEGSAYVPSAAGDGVFVRTSLSADGEASG